MNRDGMLRRVFPVPFRLLEGEQQFQKWEWIRAQVFIPRNDHRPESRRIDIDTILRLNEKVGTERGWEARKRLVEPHVLGDFDTLEHRRQSTGETLGFIRPSRILGLEIRVVREPEWTQDDLQKLLQEGLFDSEEVKSRPPLEKLGHDFHYLYECVLPDGTSTQYRHKIVDWEAGQLYRRCRHDYGTHWETAFRKKYETEFAAKDLIFMMGTIHRFPDQWLIIGVLYPPLPKIPLPQILLEL